MVIRKIWGIREKLFKEDLKRRMRMYEAPVASVIIYGVEACRWKDYEEVERVHKKYIKWSLVPERCMPWYIVLNEVYR